MNGPTGDLVIATYWHRLPAGTDVERVARSLAELQSSGAWTELATETDEIQRRHAARVLDTREVSPGEMGAAADSGTRTWEIEIGYPAHNMANQIPLLLATVYGENASWRDLKLVDLRLPEAFVHAFHGPALGVDGIRALVSATDRPLLFTIMKPSIGLSPKQSAELFYQAAVGGSDGVKDDEKLVSQPWSSFLDRVRAHKRAAQAAFEETGQRTLYFVNITDRPDRLLANAHAAVEAGASALLVNDLTVGISALEMLAEDPAIGVPVAAHLAFAGGLYGSPRTGMSPHVLLGLLPRLAGADLGIYPGHLGTLPFSREDARRVSEALIGPLGGLRRALPVAGGGMHAGLVPRMVADLGVDWGLAAGGAVHAHPMGTAAGARAIRQAIDASVHGTPLSEARGKHAELAAALDKWPEPGTEVKSR